MNAAHRLSKAISSVLCGILLLILSNGASAATAAEAPFASKSTSPSSILLGEALQFLPVEEAYQMIPSLDDHQLLIDWYIAPGYYLYEHRFAVTPVETGQPGAPLSLEHRPGQYLYDEAYEKELEVFYNSVQFRTTLASRPAEQLKALLTFKISSQGCADAGLCYPPRDQYIQVDLLSNTAVIVAAPDPALAPTIANIAEPPAFNLALILLFALLGGVILNLMPCVFPVLSIKVMATTSAHLGAHNKHVHSIAYSAGIILSFVSIAAIMLVLRGAGQSIGWGFQLQSPTFVALLAYLLFGIAQTFSGHLNIGGGWMNVGQDLTKGSGISSSFMTGVLATVVASPCTAPFMGTALGLALTQAPLVSLSVFAVLGLGMALPFLVLSWIPGLMEKLPAPGPWMTTFSQLLAFPLYASVIWLLWVLGRQTSVDHAIVISLGILLLGFAIWLHSQSSHVLSKAIIVLTVIAALSLSAARPSNDESVSWQIYSVARLAELRANNEAVFINLTADWCITCLVNERIALSSDTFHAALARHNISYLKGDWTNANSEITNLLSEHGRSGVPLYLYYDAEGSPAQVLPQLLTENLVLGTFNGK